jgi:hypothetical protein
MGQNTNDDAGHLPQLYGRLPVANSPVLPR